MCILRYFCITFAHVLFLIEGLADNYKYEKMNFCILSLAKQRDITKNCCVIQTTFTVEPLYSTHLELHGVSLVPYYRLWKPRCWANCSCEGESRRWVAVLQCNTSRPKPNTPLQWYLYEVRLGTLLRIIKPQLYNLTLSWPARGGHNVPGHCHILL